MVIKQNQLEILQKNRAFDILNEATYLTDSEASFRVQTVPIISLDEGANLVEYDYLRQMMLEVGVDLDQAKTVLAESHGIDYSSIVTIVPEWELLLNPILREEVGNFVVAPISPLSDVYFFCETMVSLYEETMDESYLALLLEDQKQDFIRAVAMDSSLTPAERQKAIEAWERKEQSDKEYQQRKKEEKIQQAKDKWEAEKKRTEEIKKKKEEQRKAIEEKKKQYEEAKKESDRQLAQRKADEENMSFPKKAIHAVKKKWMGQSYFTQSVLKKAAAVAGAVGAGGLAYGIKNRLQRIRAEAANQPRTWLAKKIAALRRIYSNYLNKARMERAQGRAGIFKTIASKILGVIDFLMKKLQHAAN